jgi:hypothetical protein
MTCFVWLLRCLTILEPDCHSCSKDPIRSDSSFWYLHLTHASQGFWVIASLLGQPHHLSALTLSLLTCQPHHHCCNHCGSLFSSSLSIFLPNAVIPRDPQRTCSGPLGKNPRRCSSPYIRGYSICVSSLHYL